MKEEEEFDAMKYQAVEQESKKTKTIENPLLTRFNDPPAEPKISIFPEYAMAVKQLHTKQMLLSELSAYKKRRGKIVREIRQDQKAEDNVVEEKRIHRRLSKRRLDQLLVTKG